MSLILSMLRWLVTRAALLVVAAVVAGRARTAWRRRARARRRSVLPSLYDRYPGATRAPRRRIGLQTVPLERVVGTMRHPSQNTGDFLPLPELRGTNWLGRWQRINRATNRLEILPPVDLVKVGDDYYIEDGHNRVAAATAAGAVDIDADVTELLATGSQPTAPILPTTSGLIGTQEIRQAATGRQPRAAVHRPAEDELTRDELLRKVGEEP
jgi:hypothetical protein